MSVQFGRCNFNGERVDVKVLAQVRPLLAPYGPDKEGYVSKDNLAALFRAFHTTKESRKETQPHLSASGAIFMWDGLLDNRSELIRELPGDLPSDSTDLAIVTAAYENWGATAFAKLIGDWALSIWDPKSQSLVLAKDFIGARHLYYSVERNEVTWCTILDPLVLFSRRSVVLEGEYVAGWLSQFPAAHLTPYVGIHSVPPASFLLLQLGKCGAKKYWDFDSRKRIRYQSDAEYEEHFRSIFSAAVRRRLRSDSPVLAELSGGMDSSSIVCMADDLITQEMAETSRLDTVSYYDDSEPNWNERPYFTIVENRRRRAGLHIDVSLRDPIIAQPAEAPFLATPSVNSSRTKANEQFAAYLVSQGNRIVLSGIGGDEVTGGVPTPTPELQDLLAKTKWGMFTTLLKLWALNKRKPWLALFLDVVRGFCPSFLVGAPKHLRPAAWLQHHFVKRYQVALSGYRSRIRLFGALPSFQESCATLDGLRRALACSALPSNPPYEWRYPFLDRGFLEFLFAIPREQLVRPGQRRSLMRRALADIVPGEIVNRKRKAFVARSPLAAIARESVEICNMSCNMASVALGIVDPNAFSEAVRMSRCEQEVPIVTLLRTLTIESWLSSQTTRLTFTGNASGASRIPNDCDNLDVAGVATIRNAQSSI